MKVANLSMCYLLQYQICTYMLYSMFAFFTFVKYYVNKTSCFFVAVLSRNGGISSSRRQPSASLNAQICM